MEISMACLFFTREIFLSWLIFFFFFLSGWNQKKWAETCIFNLLFNHSKKKESPREPSVRSIDSHMVFTINFSDKIQKQDIKWKYKHFPFFHFSFSWGQKTISQTFCLANLQTQSLLSYYWASGWSCRDNWEDSGGGKAIFIKVPSQSFGFPVLSSSGETHRPWRVRNDAGREQKWGLKNFLPLICSYRASVFNRSWVWDFIRALGAMKPLKGHHATVRKWESSHTDLLLTWKIDPLCHTSPRWEQWTPACKLLKNGCT